MGPVVYLLNQMFVSHFASSLAGQTPHPRGKESGQMRIPSSFCPVSSRDLTKCKRNLSVQNNIWACVCSGGSGKFERGVHRGQLSRRGFTAPINYNVCLLTSIRELLLVDVESDYALVHFAVR